LRLAGVIVLLLCLFSLPVRWAKSQTARSPREQVPKFKQSGPLNPPSALKKEGFLTGENALEPLEASEHEELGSNGARVMVELVHFRQDSEAYQLLSLVAAAARAKDPTLEIGPGHGIAGFAHKDEIAFFQGPYFVRLRNLKQSDEASLNACAMQVSQGLDNGEGDIPALIKHLPDPEVAQKTAIYLHSFANLDELGIQQPVFSAIEPAGNADAAFASYAPSKVLIIEFNTPQLATENDQRIVARIHELWKLGQLAPAAYRRVGNYSVFVFDAPDEQTAKQLIDQVKYEQVVQWLGDNPNIFKEAQKRYINTTLGVLVAVLKASGFALITCLGMGGLFGALLFSYRRAQQKDVAYSDAGGMLRLNLDEMTPQTNPARLLRERN